MYALTVHQPWAALIVAGRKRVEHRSWPPYSTIEPGERIAIHAAAATPDRYAVRATEPLLWSSPPLVRGAVLGTVELADWHTAADCGDSGGRCQAWAVDDGWHWVLARPRAFPEPIAATGQQGVWHWEPPPITGSAGEGLGGQSGAPR